MTKRLKASDYIYDYSSDRYLGSPHNPQWSFVEDKTCAKANYQWRNKIDGERCAIHCDECKAICEYNDYIRGMSDAHYQVPAIPEIHEWNFRLWCSLESLPVMTEEEWEREEDEWQDYLDYTDGLLPPNYQVPAIICTVRHCPDGIELHDNNPFEPGYFFFPQ